MTQVPEVNIRAIFEAQTGRPLDETDHVIVSDWRKTAKEDFDAPKPLELRPMYEKEETEEVDLD